MDRIWTGLNKPEGLEDAKLGDYFDLKFSSLPHKLLQPENFEQAALALRSQFVDAKSSEYVFQPEYKRRVPADGFPRYAEAVWEKVVSNKDLDLPTQQELLAQYRCDEIAAAALIPFRAAIDALRPRVREGEIVQGLGEVARTARSQALGAFDDQAARYHSEVYAKKRSAFVQTLDGELHALALNQVKNALSQAADTFSSQSHKALEKAESSDRSFSVVVGAVRKRVSTWFNDLVDSLTIEGAEWTLAAEVKQLEAMLDTITAKLREAEMERALKQLRRQAQDTLSEAVADRLNNPDEAMWSGVMAGFDAANAEAEQQLRRRMDMAEVYGGEQRSKLQRALRSGVWEDMVRALKEEVADQMVLLKLRSKLEDRFRYDEAGLPRVWRPSDDIDAQFAQARSAAQALLPLFSRIDTSASSTLPQPVSAAVGTFFPPGFDVERSLVLISASRQRELGKRFGREADALYLEAKRAMVTTQNHVPVWVMVLLVLLGWNEAMTILFNPLYLVLTALVAGSAFVLHNLRLWGPAVRAVGGLVNVANDHVHELLVEAVNRTDPGRNRDAPAEGRSRRQARSEEIEMDPLGDSSKDSSVSRSSNSSHTKMSQNDIQIKSPDEVKSYPATMKVYTRTGDKGTSSLFTGERRDKNDAVFAALGTTDELSSMLGLAIAHLESTPASSLIPRLETIQCLLQDVGSNIATPIASKSQAKVKRTRFDAQSVHCTRLEEWIDEYAENLPVHRSFILPSGGLAASTIHVARTICRRAERELVLLLEDIDKETFMFVNRLSDFLFVAARWVAMQQGVTEKIYVHQAGRNTEFDK
ncbi:Dynamin-like GTPase that mediates homotypic ER fusion [Coemansia sp. RSA 520]|nr:Dynamin-like GTPase that mediates homotypic ER fusion [Coemansia sp. RSA 520]KAJ2431765.1 Dynamin-like GTPase that mediates homotypic ER fusion [Coemansia sp. RSA 2522]